MTKVISTKDLKQKIDKQEDFYLVDVLSEQSFEARHIPGAINVPNGPEFVDKLKGEGIKESDEVIVYCSSATCGASPAAARALEESGFENVSHYKDGLAGWEEAGYKFKN